MCVRVCLCALAPKHRTHRNEFPASRLIVLTPSLISPRSSYKVYELVQFGREFIHLQMFVRIHRTSATPYALATLPLPPPTRSSLLNLRPTTTTTTSSENPSHRTKTSPRTHTHVRIGYIRSLTRAAAASSATAQGAMNKRPTTSPVRPPPLTPTPPTASARQHTTHHHTHTHKSARKTHTSDRPPPSSGLPQFATDSPIKRQRRHRRLHSAQSSAVFSPAGDH